MVWTRWSDLAIGLGALGQVAYLAEPSKAHLTVWWTLGLILAPYLIMLFFQFGPGEAPVRWVMRLRLIACIWFLVLTALCLGLATTGYRPEGWLLFLAMMAPGTRYCARALPDLVRLRRDLEPPL